ncbi:STAS domain-containing protein [Nonomuraea soli]|uniref:Anti-anti-sigma regulatory factor n=1 Tax=Nonomuraea soli TaxID=1032476 RepID=A0A7W0CV34_9ACTN|nr:STAS domain-containing protein [Nonomuraea soli]MBA2897898.1 anti-anti-sigma regulatory factor [Nonomuraea soli]
MVISMSGDLAAGALEEAEAYIMHDLIASCRDGTTHLVLDLTDVASLDAAGANLLTRVRFAVQSQRATMSAVVPQGARPYRTLEQLGLISHLGVFSSLEAITLAPSASPILETIATETVV